MAVSTWYIRMTAVREIFCSSCNLQKKKNTVQFQSWEAVVAVEDGSGGQGTSRW